MKVSDFDYDLPQSLIAQQPLSERSDSRLLVVDPLQEKYVDQQFQQILDYFEPGDLLIFNDTRVFPARLYGQKSSGGKIEVLVERLLDDNTLLAHIRSSKSPKPGAQLLLEGEIKCLMTKRQGELFVLQQDSDKPWLKLLQKFGHIPLPPYITRPDTSADHQRYQTVYAKNTGAVAAPTAGLHFDEAIMSALKDKAVNTAFITLHVGAGTFQPVRVENLDQHKMHQELVSVSPEVCGLIRHTRKIGKRIVAVGTTVVRSLESAAKQTGDIQTYEGDTGLFIKPGFDFKVVDAMITNFHLPRSTLLMLVSAFAGMKLINQAYRHAVEQQYRFFSYGDAMLIKNRKPNEV